MSIRSVVPAVFAVSMGSMMLLPGAAFAQQQNKAQQNCLNNLNKAGAQVAKMQGKENHRCVKDAGKGKLSGTAQDCLTADPKMRVQKKKDKTITQEQKHCSTPPNFGYTNSATINTYTQQGELDLLADVFGANLDAAVIDCDINKAACKCQEMITKFVEKVAAVKFAEFVRCKKAVLKAGATAPVDLENCIDDPGTPLSIAADTKERVEKAVANLNKQITKKCDDEGVTLGSFPGKCDGQNGVALGTCLDVLAECRVCQTINDTDALFVNCDLFDDGSPNASCDSGAGPTPTITSTPTNTGTPTETPTVDPSQEFLGALPRTSGRFNFMSTIGITGADAECNFRFPGTHACTFAELLNAESQGELVGATDVNGMTVTAFWAIDSTRPDVDQCTVSVPWDYNTAHTGQFADASTLNNGTGDLSPIAEDQNCGSLRWVGCCQ